MWPRKQLDIGWSDLAFGLSQIIASRERLDAHAVIGQGWIPNDEAVVSLSVRSGWDLFLEAHRFAPGDEIIVSSVTIPDMVRIIERHDLVAVPVAVDCDRLEPSLDDLERAITPRTRAILVAHLFGARIDMEPVIRLAKQRDLIVVEDCAQAFVGRDYAGHEDSDCSLFSFGPIKTATALGGAVVRVRDAAVRRRMVERQQAYPVQTNRAYLHRLAKYTMFRVICWPWVFGFLVRAFRLCGADYDRVLGKAAHSFPGAAFFDQIRRQPCAALMRLLQRRLAMFETRDGLRLRRRTARGNQLANALPPGMVVGSQNETHTYWVMPLRVANAADVLPALQRAGFDATGRSSLVAVRGAEENPANSAACAPWLADTIFLPNGHDIPDSEWMRVSLILLDVARVAAEHESSEPTGSHRVPVPS
jgi:dTDP-4-amino-4,6-dideoxygalactose transaminase